MPSRARRHARQRGEPDGLRCQLPPDPAAAATASLHLFGGLPAYVHEVSDRDAALHRLPDLLLDVPLKASPRVPARMMQEAPSTLPAEIAQHIAQLKKVMTAK